MQLKHSWNWEFFFLKPFLLQSWVFKFKHIYNHQSNSIPPPVKASEFSHNQHLPVVYNCTNLCTKKLDGSCHFLLLQILSLGAGQMDKTHELSRAKKWGMTGWVRPIMDIMMDGTAGTCSCLQIYQVNSLLSLTAHWTSLNLGPWLDFIIDEQGINYLPVASHRWGFCNTKLLKTWPTHQL
jgi:hypothetical protein